MKFGVTQFQIRFGQLVLVQNQDTTVRVGDHVDIEVVPVDGIVLDPARQRDVAVPALKFTVAGVNGERIERVGEREKLEKDVIRIEDQIAEVDSSLFPGTARRHPSRRRADDLTRIANRLGTVWLELHDRNWSSGVRNAGSVRRIERQSLPPDDLEQFSRLLVQQAFVVSLDVQPQ